MADTVRVGFVGSGGMAREHLKSLAPMDDVAIVALSDPDPAKPEARIEELHKLRPDAPAPAVFGDAATMIRETQPDAVYLLLPPFAHGDPERACLEHHVPFFVEKPVGLDQALTVELVAAVEQQGLTTSAGYMNRYRRSIQRAKELLAEDPPVLVHGGWIGGSPSPQPGATDIGSWWVQKDKSGGQIVEQCTHTFDVVRYLCGEATEVYAQAANGFNQGLYNYTIDDASSVTLKLAGGGVANLMSCCACNGGGVWLNVYAKEHTFLFTGWDHKLRLLAKGSEPEEIAGEPDIFAVEDRAFIDAVKSGDASGIRCTYPDAARTLYLTLAANQSIADGAPVSVG